MDFEAFSFNPDDFVKFVLLLNGRETKLFIHNY